MAKPCDHVEHARGVDGYIVGKGRQGLWDDCPWQNAADDEQMPADGQVDVRPWQPEDGDSRCQQCGHPNPVWRAPNRLWNAIVGGDPRREAGGVLCPTCFAEMAELTLSDITGWSPIPRRRGETDQKLASIMRKLLATDVFVSTSRHNMDFEIQLTIDDTTVVVTEDELQALEELMDGSA